MARTNRKAMSLYQEAKAGLSSLTKQMTVVGIGFLALLMVTGGRPPTWLIGVGFFSSTLLVAWMEQERITRSRKDSLRHPESFLEEPSGTENRMFRYEAEGMRQTYETDQLSYPIRASGSVYITVPHNRMNEEMQRILRMGGRIVSIEPMMLDGNSDAKTQAATAHQNLEAEGKSEATEAQQTTSVANSRFNKEVDIATNDIESQQIGRQDITTTVDYIKSRQFGTVTNAIKSRQLREDMGTVTNAIKPQQAGRVEWRTTWWDAVCPFDIELPAGTQVRIVQTINITLIVEPLLQENLDTATDSAVIEWLRQKDVISENQLKRDVKQSE